MRCGDGVCAPGWEDWQSCDADCEPPPGPDNDACADAAVLEVAAEVVVEGTSAAAGHDFSGYWLESPDVWYRFSLADASVLDLLLEGEDDWDTYLFLLRGTCEAWETLDENDDWDRVGNSRIPEAVLDPGDYLVVVAGWDEDCEGPFRLTAAFAEPE